MQATHRDYQAMAQQRGESAKIDLQNELRKERGFWLALLAVWNEVSWPANDRVSGSRRDAPHR